MAVPGVPFLSVGVSDGIMDPPSASPLFYSDSVTPPFSPSHHLRSPARRPRWFHPLYSPLSTLMGKVATKLDRPADRPPDPDNAAGISSPKSRRAPPLLSPGLAGVGGSDHHQHCRCFTLSLSLISLDLVLCRLPILPPHKTTMVSDKELGPTLVEDATQPLPAIVGAVLRRTWRVVFSEVRWGSLSLVDEERRILSNALLDFSNQRFMLLSESCIPLFNFSVIYRYLIGSEHSFIESYDLDDKDVRGRYNPKMDPNDTVEQWRKGSAWFELSRDMAVSLVVDSKYYSLFKEYCNLSPCFPDEHYIPTLMNLFNGAKEANRIVTWTDWSRRGPHPARFGQESITESFIQSIRNSNNTCLYNSEPTSVCFLFATKFTPSVLEPLLNLASTVMHY